MNPFTFLRFSDCFSLVYITKAFALSYLPTLFLSLIVAVIVRVEEPTFDHIGPELLLPSLVIIGPMIETLIMWPIIFILEKIRNNYFFVVITSALLWAAFHSLQTPTWGFFIFWPFIIFSSTMYIGRKTDKSKALFATCAIHALHNFPSALALMVDV